MTELDTIVIGAGVVGLAVAARLADGGRRIAILEKNDRFGRETSSRNSEVIHAGIYNPPSFLKTRLCVTGSWLLYRWCEEHGVSHRRTGKLIVAQNEKEEEELLALYQKGLTNGVEGLRLVGRKEIAALEPSVRATAALLSARTGIVDSHGLMRSLLLEAEGRGAILSCRSEVTAVSFDGGSYLVEVNDGDYRLRARTIVNSGGLRADAIAAMAGLDVDKKGYRLRYCRGNYFTASPSPALRHLVYPVPPPEAVGLGIHATIDLAGRVRFGPDHHYIDSPDYRVDEDRAPLFREAASRYLPHLAAADFHPDMCGIRPKLQGPGEAPRDFVIREETEAGLPGFVNLVGIESPGLTASLAIAAYVGDLLRGV